MGLAITGEAMKWGPRPMANRRPNRYNRGGGAHHHIIILKTINIIRIFPEASFEWDDRKNIGNGLKHRIFFEEAQYAFADPRRLILYDVTHSTEVEKRYYCVGMLPRGIVTVRFVLRPGRIRIIGAGFWRKGRRIYESENR